MVARTREFIGVIRFEQGKIIGAANAESPFARNAAQFWEKVFVTF